MKLVALITMVVFPLSFAAMGCGDACDDALDKYEECGIDVSGGDDDDDVECEGQVLCFAECVNDASCDDLMCTEHDKQYLKCVADCL